MKGIPHIKTKNLLNKDKMRKLLDTQYAKDVTNDFRLLSTSPFKRKIS